MNTLERLDAEAASRSTQLTEHFPPGRCVSCATAGGKNGLRPVRLTWRKQVGKGEAMGLIPPLRVEHASDHSLCPTCLTQLTDRRRWWPAIRLTAGFALGGAICGVAGSLAVRYLMRLNPSEQSANLWFVIASLLLVPIAYLLWQWERNLSVPRPLRRFARRGWECWSVDVLEPAVAIRPPITAHAAPS